MLITLSRPLSIYFIDSTSETKNLFAADVKSSLHIYFCPLSSRTSETTGLHSNRIHVKTHIYHQEPPDPELTVTSWKHADNLLTHD